MRSSHPIAAALVAAGALTACGAEPDERRATTPPAATQTAVKRPPHPVWCPDAGVLTERRERQPGAGTNPRPRSDDEPPPPPGRFDAREVLGLPIDRADAQAAKAGCAVRVVEEDGEFLARTEDLRADRVNVAVANGAVVAIDGVY